MSDLNNIDELFRNGIEREYPVDDGLWSAVEAQLPYTSAPKPWYFNLNSIVLGVVLITCSFIQKDNTRASQTNINPEIIKNASTAILTSKSDQLTEITRTSAKELLLRTTPYKTNQPNQSKKAKSPTTKTKITTPPGQTTNASATKVNYDSTPRIKDALRTLKKQSEKIHTKENLAALTLQPISLHKPKEFPLLSTISIVDSFITFDQKAMHYPMLVDCLKYDLKPSSSHSFEVESFYSISIHKSLNNGDNSLLNNKKRGEKAIDFKSTGLNYVKQKKFLVYGLGIQQSTYTERYSYSVNLEKTRINLTYDTTYQLVSGNFNSNGTPVFLIQQEVTENVNEETYSDKVEVIGRNTIKRVGVPLFIGAHKSYQNWMMQVRFSVIPQFIYNLSGNYLANDLNNLTELSETEIKTWSLGNRNDLSLGYTVNEKFVVGAKYSVLNDLNSFTKTYDSKLSGQLIGVWILWKL